MTLPRNSEQKLCHIHGGYAGQFERCPGCNEDPKTTAEWRKADGWESGTCLHSDPAHTFCTKCVSIALSAERESERKRCAEICHKNCSWTSEKEILAPPSQEGKL